MRASATRPGVAGSSGLPLASERWSSTPASDLARTSVESLIAPIISRKFGQGCNKKALARGRVNGADRNLRDCLDTLCELPQIGGELRQEAKEEGLHKISRHTISAAVEGVRRLRNEGPNRSARETR